jgi:hypothetical protein
VVARTREELEKKGLYKREKGVKEVVGYGHYGDGESIVHPIRIMD